MAWEDRTKAQKAEARRAAKAYKASDDDKTYEVLDAKGRVRFTATGRNSANAIAKKTDGGTIRPKK
jgi:hypothetical protein